MRICFLFSLLIFFSCNDGLDKSSLYGSWKTVDWYQEDSGNRIQQKMDFDFSEDGRYVVDYGSQNEKGDWWVRGNFLHTREDDQMEKKVHISSIMKDTMRMDMNRGGILETVVLVKFK